MSMSASTWAGIFIRSLNPYGFAAQQAARLGYDMKTFVEKYLTC